MYGLLTEPSPLTTVDVLLIVITGLMPATEVPFVLVKLPSAPREKAKYEPSPSRKADVMVKALELMWSLYRK